MSTYVLIAGAGGSPSYWYLVAAELRKRGHDVLAVDLPGEDESAGLAEYADVVVDTIGDRTDVVLVAHSFGGFTAPLVCERVPVQLLVLVCGMVAVPGESPGEWWGNTGYGEARREISERQGWPEGAEEDPSFLFFPDVPPKVVEEVLKDKRDQAGTPFMKPWPLKAWPDVPTRFLLATEDRFFPADFLRRVVRERLNMIPDEMPGSHGVALSRPVELVDRLEAYQASV